MKSTYRKVRFTSKANGSTAGLVIESDRFERMSITDFSRLFPYSEASKMRTLQVSPEFPTWEAAFDHSFES